ncbi:serine hydroxymethyltransferase [Candidatus Bathyarchaeota archaeon]|nr:MAG: serine hydroxymethyltransferase [Candidatus Bathyarchaeota archaeon]
MTISSTPLHIKRILKKHHQWRSSCINLIASENITSPAVRETLASDFSHRYAEGEPFKRLYGGTKYVDEVEVLAIDLAKEVFEAEHVNIKPVSGCQANHSVLYAFTNPNDTILTLSLMDGGHISYMDFGGAGIRNLKVENLPFNQEEMNIDVNVACEKIKEIKPKICFLGGSVILFPPPVNEIKKVAEDVGTYVIYDASHVLGLIAGKQLQNPLHEGADVVTSSTHKTFPGPQGGMVLCKKEFAEKIDKAVFPGLVSNHHLHHVAALTITLMEMKRFGVEYAKQIVKNAKALAKNLYDKGFEVLCPHKGFTETHQVLVNVARLGGGKNVANLLEKANIICNKNMLPGDNLKTVDNPSGIRLGVAEVTRLGLKESDMEQVADFIKQVVLDRKDPKKIAGKVKVFMEKFSTVKYCFQRNKPAYKYVDFY